MSKKTRTILFSFLAILFLLTALIATFYSQGYRFDFERKKVVQTGAFSFKVWPKGALIYLDGKLSKKTDFLFGNAFIENLLPKKYKIEIKKDGYHPWQKSLEISEKWVTEAKNVFLIPKNPRFIISENEVENFFFSPDEKKVVLKKGVEEDWNLNLLDLEKNKQFPLFKGEQLLKKDRKIKFIDLNWSADSKKILLKIIDKEFEYFIIELDKERSLISLDFLGKELIEVSFDPENSQRIFFIQNLTDKNSLFSVDYNKREISQPILENLITYQIFNGSLFWLDREGFFFQADLSGRKIRSFNLTPFSLKPEGQYQIIIFPKKIFLKENGNFYFFDENYQSFEKILEKVKEVKISPDFKKMVYFTDYEIWILFLEAAQGQPQKKEGEKLFLTRFSEKIGDVFWYTSHYLIFNTGNIIKIAEIDDRDKINICDLFEFKNSKIFWNKIYKKLYLLSEGDLYSSGKLLP